MTRQGKLSPVVIFTMAALVISLAGNWVQYKTAREGAEKEQVAKVQYEIALTSAAKSDFARKVSQAELSLKTIGASDRSRAIQSQLTLAFLQDQLGKTTNKLVDLRGRLIELQSN